MTQQTPPIEPDGDSSDQDGTSIERTLPSLMVPFSELGNVDSHGSRQNYLDAEYLLNDDNA